MKKEKEKTPKKKPLQYCNHIQYTYLKSDCDAYRTLGCNAEMSQYDDKHKITHFTKYL